MLALAFASIDNSNPQEDKTDKCIAEASKTFINASVATLPVLLKFACVFIALVAVIILALPKAAGDMITPEFYMNTAAIFITVMLGFAAFLTIIGVFKELYKG